jgi:hypothetical protein
VIPLPRGLKKACLSSAFASASVGVRMQDSSSAEAIVLSKHVTNMSPNILLFISFLGFCKTI